MVKRGKSRAVDPRLTPEVDPRLTPEKAFEALEELTRALRHAIKHPMFDAKGRLVYQVRDVERLRANALGPDPVSRPRAICRRLHNGCWDGKAMDENIGLYPRIAGYLYLGASAVPRGR
jgi:hypothetical protein